VVSKLKRLVAMGVLLALFALGTAQAIASTIELSFMFPSTGSRAELYRELVDEFESEHPEISINMVPHTWSTLVNFTEEVVVLSAADVMPDVIITPFQGVNMFGKQGLLYDLTPLLERDAANTKPDDILPPALEANTIEERTYGIPVGIESVWVTYNPNVFDEAGLGAPDTLVEAGTWDFDALRELAIRTTTRHSDGTVDRYGMVFPAALEMLPAWLWGMGGDMYDADTNRIVLDQEGAVDGLAFLSAMLHEDLTTGIGWGPGPHGVALNALAAQSRVALNPWWHGIATEYPNWGASYMPDQVPFPAGPVSVRTTAIRATEAGNAAINR